MNAESNAVPESPSQLQVTAAVSTATRPFYWSIRRELWENRSIFIAPLVAAAVVLAAFLINAMHLPDGVRIMSTLEPARQRAMLTSLYSGASVLIVITMAIVAWFYCLDALHGERRDRSILFWKSLPVSDLTTVLSKISIPAVVLPLITCVVVMATQLIILLTSTVILLANGLSAATLWAQLPIFQMWLVLLYSLIVFTIWYAPIYGWLLFVSAWARRSTFLWAVLPPLAICVVEKIAFHSDVFWEILQQRLSGGFTHAFVIRSRGNGFIIDNNMSGSLQATFPDPLLQLIDPVRFLSSPGVWIGLAIAAGFLAAVVWLRRYREPI